MPIPSTGLTRRQRAYGELVQNLPTKTITYRYLNGTSDPGWPDVIVKQPATKRVGDQVTDSEEHSGWRSRLKEADSRLDVGGNFYTQKRYVEGFPSYLKPQTGLEYVTAGLYRRTIADGPFWAIDARLHNFPPSFCSTDDQLDELGATAVSRCKPTNSAANVGVALGELVREGIPRLAVETWKRRATRPDSKTVKQGSKEYLAYQFGLAPLGQEIGSFAYQVTQADRLLAQYERDAGRIVRRRYEFPTKTEESVRYEAGTYPVYMGGPETGMYNPSLTNAQLCELQVERSIVQKRWFSGAFTYFLPPWYDARNEMSRKALLAKEILGLDLDEEVIWNLTPWSWAIDWFTNAGDVISTASSVREDGLIMRYGYMMEHTIVKDTYSRRYPVQFINGWSVGSRVSLVTETKIRRRANPFGFGLTWEGLDSFQLSILAALGISRK